MKNCCSDALLTASLILFYSIGDFQLRNITKSYLERGVVAPTKSSGGANKTALTTDDIHRAVTYITNFGEQHGLVIPGRISGVKSSDPRIRLLRTDQTKLSVWRSYESDLITQNEDRVKQGILINNSFIV